MNTYSGKSRKDKAPVSSGSRTVNQPAGNASRIQFSDNRQSTATLKALQRSAHEYFSSSHIGIRGKTGRKETASVTEFKSPPVQRTVWESAGYTRSGMTGLSLVGNQSILNEWSDLNDKVPTAEANASAAVTNATTQKTNRQRHYILQQDAKTWGSVVEEQLDPLAQALGWKTQQVLDGSRPDYCKLIAGFAVYADLTTPGESGPGGPHLGGKLATAGVDNTNSCGADITHNKGSHSGVAADPYAGMHWQNKNWLVECAEMRTLLKKHEQSENGLPYIEGVPEDYGSHIAGSAARERSGNDRTKLRKIFALIRAKLG